MSLRMMTEAFRIRVGNPARKLVLLKLADNANDEGECWPSYGHIARECEIGRSTVKAHIKALEQAGFLRIEHRRKGTQNQSNVYYLTIEKGQPIERVPPTRKKPAAVHEAANDESLLTSEPSAPSSTLVASHGAARQALPLDFDDDAPAPAVAMDAEAVNVAAIAQGFAVFYNAGLPKKSRQRAESAFKRQAKKHGDPVAFGKMVAENIKGRLGTGELGFDSMHPSTYLNQQRWLDETGPSAGNCPYETIIDLWEKIMPEFRQHAKELWPQSKRAADLENRWNAGFIIKHAKTGQPLYTTEEEGIDWWGRFFGFLRKSPFLMNGTTWLSLEWIVERDHFDAILELKYHDGSV